MNIYRRMPIVLVLCGLLLATAELRAAPDDREPPPEPEAAQQGQFADENFDQWVFQGFGNAEAGRKRITTGLTLQVDEVDRVCGLTDDQKQKLKLAGGGDSQRFFAEVEEVRKKFLANKNDQNAFGNIWQDIQPLQTKLAGGLFGDRSLFAKTLRRALSNEQIAKYDAVREERRQFRYRASIEAAVASLENSIALRDEQREIITKLLLERSQPPDAFGQNEFQFVLYRLSRLSMTKEESRLDERQWKALQQQLQGYRNMKQFLVQQGMLAKEGDE
jgi:hypothetical protein